MSAKIFTKLQNDSQNLQAWILKKLTKKPDSVWVLLTYLLAECGELADKARALEGNRVKSTPIKRGDLAQEIVDCIYNLMLIANLYEIDLDNHWQERLKDIKNKFA